MKQKLFKLHNKLMNLSSIKLILLMFFSIIIIQILIAPLYKLFPINIPDSEYYNLNNFLEPSFLIAELLRVGIRAPIVETLICQTLIIRMVWGWMRMFFEDRSFFANFIPIFISSVVFGFLHYLGYSYSLVKALNTFLVGVILAYTYVISYFSKKKASLNVMLVHSLWNVFSLVINYIFASYLI